MEYLANKYTIKITKGKKKCLNMVLESSGYKSNY